MVWRIIPGLFVFAALFAAETEAQQRSFSSRHAPNAAQGLDTAGRGGLHVGRTTGTGGLARGRTMGTGGLRGRRTTKADDLATPDAPEVYRPPYRRRVR